MILTHFRVFRFPRAQFLRVGLWQNLYFQFKQHQVVLISMPYVHLINTVRRLLSEPAAPSFPHSPPTSDRRSRSGAPLPRQAPTDAKLGYYWNH